MAFTQVNTSTVTQGTASTLVNTVVATTQGNVLVVHLELRTAGLTCTSITDDKGNTYVLQAAIVHGTSNADTCYQAYGVQVTGGATTVTAHMSGTGSSNNQMCCDEYSAGTPWADNTDAFDVSHTNSSGSGTGSAPNCGTLTPSVSGELVVATIGESGLQVFTAGTNYTRYGAGANSTIIHSQYRLSATTSETAPGSLPGGQSWACRATAFKVPGGTTLALSGTMRCAMRAPSAALLSDVALAGKLRSEPRMPSAQLGQATALSGTARSLVRAPSASLGQSTALAGTLCGGTRVPGATLAQATALAGRIRSVERFPSAALSQAVPLSGVLRVTARAPAAVLSQAVALSGTVRGAARLPAASLSHALALAGVLRDATRAPAAQLDQAIELGGTLRNGQRIPATMLDSLVALAGAMRATSRASAAELDQATALAGMLRGVARSRAATLLSAVELAGVLRTIARVPAAEVEFIILLQLQGTVRAAPVVAAAMLDQRVELSGKIRTVVRGGSAQLDSALGLAGVSRASARLIGELVQYLDLQAATIVVVVRVLPSIFGEPVAMVTILRPGRGRLLHTGATGHLVHAGASGHLVHTGATGRIDA